MKRKSWISTVTIAGLLLLLSTAYKSIEQKNTVTDYDGNVYRTVKIGKQIWMVENLKTTHYRNGDPITHVQDNKKWLTMKAGEAYCNYDNDPDNAEIYGRLYNKAAIKDSRSIAPVGWHVPTAAEWEILQAYLGGPSVSGGKLKEAGTVHWANPNKGASNSSGFTGLPGGFRYHTGEFRSMGFSAFWWAKPDKAYSESFRLLHHSAMSINTQDGSGADGFSVRCIKD